MGWEMDYNVARLREAGRLFGSGPSFSMVRLLRHLLSTCFGRFIDLLLTCCFLVRRFRILEEDTEMKWFSAIRRPPSRIFLPVYQEIALLPGSPHPALGGDWKDVGNVAADPLCNFRSERA